MDDALGPGTIVARTQGKQQVARPPQVRVAASDAVADPPAVTVADTNVRTLQHARREPFSGVAV